MPENSNVEMAHTLAEHAEHAEPTDARRHRWQEVAEIFEALFLAIVAITTAWSGYQSAKWDGEQVLLYGEATRHRFEASEAATYAGQELVADSAMLNAWLLARGQGEKETEELIVRRFTPDYRVAFDAWLKTDPEDNEDAPPGPAAMPEYENPYSERADQLNDRASREFIEGTESRQTAEKYVRNTVALAAVLFVIAIAQRFKIRAVRFASLGVAIVLMALTLYSVATLPRL